MKNIRLGDLLIELGYITPDQLNTALAYQKEHRDLRVGQALQELGYVNERQVLEALAKRLQIQLIDIEHTTVDVTAVEKVPQELAQKYDMLPIAQSARTLTVAANDPLFRNVTTNNWSGQAEALTYQRAIRALENYGMYELIPQLGQKLMQAIGPQCRFVQQYDPFTGEPSVICEPGQPPQDAYGPAMLSVLEYTARMYGVSLVRDTVVWGTCPLECRYTQALNGRSWEIVNSGHEAEAFVDGRKVFTAGPGLRITTDLDGNVLGTARYLPDADPAQVTPQ